MEQSHDNSRGKAPALMAQIRGRMMKWEDITSHSRNQTDRSPRTWMLKAGDLRIIVTRLHGCDQSKWFLRCYPFFDAEQLVPTDTELAKQSAVDLVKQKIDAALYAIK